MSSREEDPIEDPAVLREVARQKEVILRGAQDVITSDELDRKLARSIRDGKPLRVKLGVDPTASLLHLGFTVVLRKLRAFQDLGHQAVLIIGDVTARVGDPTGKSKMRPRLSIEEVQGNAEGYLEQAARVIDVEKAEIRRNSEWLAGMGFEDLVGLLARATVAQLLERDDFSGRHKAGTPIYLHEFLYPLLQGWDSVMVEADVELGGTDQLFNLLVGRDLQAQEGQESQVCLTTPLLIGLDGVKKMSKSHDNTVGITEEPLAMMKKIMRVDDGQMRDWFTLLTRVPESEIASLLEEGTNPRDLKLRLGAEIIDSFHAAGAGRDAADAWVREVANKEVPDDLPELSLATLDGTDAGFGIVDLLVAAGFAKSRSEARRLIKGGAVSVGETRISDTEATVAPPAGTLLRAGKKRLLRLVE